MLGLSRLGTKVNTNICVFGNLAEFLAQFTAQEIFPMKKLILGLAGLFGLASAYGEFSSRGSILIVSNNHNNCILFGEYQEIPKRT